ncbi:MAG TPA: hypothetical protein VHW01_29590 [Polyangiaceae bacterium]|nr:hypothetical protein [Polyangiaceae bacterium]
MTSTELGDTCLPSSESLLLQGARALAGINVGNGVHESLPQDVECAAGIEGSIDSGEVFGRVFANTSERRAIITTRNRVQRFFLPELVDPRCDLRCLLDHCSKICVRLPALAGKLCFALLQCRLCGAKRGTSRLRGCQAGITLRNRLLR